MVELTTLRELISKWRGQAPPNSPKAMYAILACADELEAWIAAWDAQLRLKIDVTIGNTAPYEHFRAAVLGVKE